MKNIIIIAVKLAVICLVAAFVLGYVNGITAPQIAASKAQAELNALSVINKAGTIGEKVEGDGAGVNYYYPVTDGGKVTNYIMSLKEDADTPGLGKKAENSWYMDKFKGTGADKPVPVKKTMLESADADAVTGATITFTGVSKALEYGSEFAKKLGGQK